MSSGSEDDEDIPPTAECDILCKSFAQITNTDEACAQFYLQDRKWNLERSVNDFFEDRSNKGALRVNKKSEAEVVLVMDDSPRNLAAAATAIIAETALCAESGGRIPLEPRQGKVKARESSEQKMTNKELKFITWNMDGLNEKNLSLRTRAICKRILSEDADIVFLQEVVPESASYFEEKLKGYDCYFGNDMGYFLGSFLKKASMKYECHEIIEFPESRMMRNVLQINAKLGTIPLCLMNTHLESTAEGADERKIQLKKVLSEILDATSEQTVLCGGDMNLRDKEVQEIGGLPAGVEDVWISCGSRKEVTHTWDMTRNDNLIIPGKFKPRMRFDRVYLRGSSPGKILPKFFGLIGLERLLPHRCFPSDHWGILCHFDIQ